MSLKVTSLGPLGEYKIFTLENLVRGFELQNNKCQNITNSRRFSGIGELNTKIIMLKMLGRNSSEIAKEFSAQIGKKISVDQIDKRISRLRKNEIEHLEILLGFKKPANFSPVCAKDQDFNRFLETTPIDTLLHFFERIEGVITQPRVIECFYVASPCCISIDNRYTEIFGDKKGVGRNLLYRLKQEIYPLDKFFKLS